MKTKAKSNTKPKNRPFKMFYVGKEWDTVFMLPTPAFKLWVFYYRLEGAKREGWASRETISEKCGMTPEAVTDWRKYLVANGWMRQVGEHKIPNNPIANTPIMRVCRGTLPVKIDKRGKSAGSQKTQFQRGGKLSDTAGTENLPDRAVTETFRAAVTETTVPARTETFPRNVDVNPEVNKTLVDGPAKRPDFERFFQ